MKIIGLTGSIASGKSTIGRMFRQYGMDVHDADKTVHQLLSPSGKATPVVADYFGREVLAADGSGGQAGFGMKIFADPEARNVLEGILHPLVYQSRQRFWQISDGQENPLRCWMCRSCLKPAGMRDAIIWSPSGRRCGYCVSAPCDGQI